MEQEALEVSPARVAQALAADYFCIYYVNTKNNKFIEYSASEEYRALGLPRSGEDFIVFYGSVLSQSYIRKTRSGSWMDS